MPMSQMSHPTNQTQQRSFFPSASTRQFQQPENSLESMHKNQSYYNNNNSAFNQFIGVRQNNSNFNPSLYQHQAPFNVNNPMSYNNGAHNLHQNSFDHLNRQPNFNFNNGGQDLFRFNNQQGYRQDLSKLQMQHQANQFNVPNYNFQSGRGK